MHIIFNWLKNTHISIARALFCNTCIQKHSHYSTGIMPLKKSLIIVNDQEVHNDQNGINDHSGSLSNGFHAKHNEKSVQILDYSKINNSNKELFLLKLPKELIKYQEQFGDLSFNFKDIKNHIRFTVDDVEYEARLTKEKLSLNCLSKSGASFIATDNFKNVINVKRFIDMPLVNAPSIEIKHVEIPESIENYLEKKRKSEHEANQEHLVNKKKRKSKNPLVDNLESLTDSVIKRSKNNFERSCENKTNNFLEKTKTNKNKKHS